MTEAELKRIEDAYKIVCDPNAEPRSASNRGAFLIESAPELIAEVRRLTAENARLRKACQLALNVGSSSRGMLPRNVHDALTTALGASA